MSKTRRHTRALWIAVAVAFTACGGGEESGGGSNTVVIPDSDSTPPTVRLTVVYGGDSILVTDGGQPASLSPTAGGPLTLQATVEDPESGGKEIQVWIDSKVTQCRAAGTCQTQQGLLGEPAYKTSKPTANPGDTSNISLTLTKTHQTDFPPKPQPGESWTVELTIWAVGLNYLSGKAQTAEATVTWSRATPA
jgi:hypothetical protein